MLLICGEDDRRWPSCTYADTIAARRGERPYTQIRVPRAGHYVGVVVPDEPIPAGGTQQDDAVGRLDDWPKLLRFLAAR